MGASKQPKINNTCKKNNHQHAPSVKTHKNAPFEKAQTSNIYSSYILSSVFPVAQGPQKGIKMEAESGTLKC